MSKVYITQERQFDFSSAEEYGDLVFLSVDDMWNGRNSPHNAKLIEHLYDQLKDFNSDKDFIILSGSDMVIAAVFMLLGRLQVRRVSILRWSNRDRIYELAEIRLGSVL